MLTVSTGQTHLVTQLAVYAARTTVEVSPSAMEHQQATDFSGAVDCCGTSLLLRGVQPAGRWTMLINMALVRRPHPAVLPLGAVTALIATEEAGAVMKWP